MSVSGSVSRQGYVVSFLDYSEFRAQKFFAPLDVVRAAAVLTVVAWHVEQSDILRSVKGGRGVEWFFALSGFLITTLALREEDRSGSLSVGSFYVRRAFRILPMYLVALISYVVSDVVVFQNSAHTEAWKSYWFYYVSFLQDIPVSLHWDGAPFQVAWSLAVEERFYILWPVLAFVICPKAARLPAASGLAVLMSTYVAFGPLSDMRTLTEPFVPIILGCVGAILVHKREWYGTISRLARPWVFFPLIGLVAVPWPDAVRSTGSGQVIYHFLVAIAIVLIAQLGGGAPGWLLWIGRRSYAIYLFHTLVIRVVGKFVLRVPLHEEVHGLIIFTIALPVSCLLADLLHRFVEQPLIKRGRQLGAPKAPIAVAV